MSDQRTRAVAVAVTREHRRSQDPHEDTSSWTPLFLGFLAYVLGLPVAVALLTAVMAAFGGVG